MEMEAGSPIDANDPEINDSVEEHVLCSTCLNIVNKSRNINLGSKFRQYEQFSHYPSFQDVEASYRDGCHLCALIWHRWKDVANEASLEKASRDNRHVTVEIEKTIAPVMIDRINVNPFGRLGEPHRAQSNFRHTYLNIMRYQTCSGPGDPGLKGGFQKADWLDRSKPYHAAQVARSTASDASFTLAQYWLDKCLSGHGECSQAQSPVGQLPTRLIDIKRDDMPHLALTADLDSTPEYLALSHCWGGADIIKLQSDNIEPFQSGIAIALLPKTFRDAVVITRRLGYRYVWIDSLCIYSYRTAMKHLRNLRFMPQFSEGFDFGGVSERKNLCSVPSR
jgi:hypothetical protein